MTDTLDTSTGSTHNVVGGNPQTRLRTAAPADQNDSPESPPQNTGDPSADTSQSEDTASPPQRSPSTLGANCDGSRSSPTDASNSLPRPSPLSRLAALSPEDQKIVETLAKDLAVQLLAAQRQAMAGAANCSDTSTAHAVAEVDESGPLFRSEHEIHEVSYEHKTPIHLEITTLARKGVRPPLTLFSIYALRELHANPAANRRKYTLSAGNQIMVDVGAFGREEDLGSEAWKECWKNYLRWLSVEGDTGVYERWCSHFETLSGLAFFLDEFPAIRTFDIDERTRYFVAPAPYQADVWWSNLSSARTGFLSKENNSRIQRLESAILNMTGPNRNERSVPVRYSPYSTTPTASTTSTPTSARPSSFLPGKPAFASRKICLRCGREGEVAGSCTRSTTFRDRPVIVRWDPSARLLVSIRDSKVVFCFDFNIGGPERCKNEHPPRVQHACSVCGGHDHHAASGGCPV